MLQLARGTRLAPTDRVVKLPAASKVRSFPFETPDDHARLS
jgi:hypothetical protein